jgi:hypothetical protein
MAGAQRLPRVSVPATLSAPVCTPARSGFRSLRPQLNTIDVVRTGHVPLSDTEERAAILIHRRRGLSCRCLAPSHHRIVVRYRPRGGSEVGR